MWHVAGPVADLPVDRLEQLPCFTYCACDFFGPFMIKERRSELKRYGCLFSCMMSRAIHIEVVPSLNTSDFMNCLRRFLCRRGPVTQIRCDRGTNFVGCNNEMKQALSEMDYSSIKQKLLQEKCEWIDFKFNTPASSHMGGSWERMIRTIRSILNGILGSNRPNLNNDELNTLMCEVESVLNSRPLTAIDQSNTLEPLTPNHLLTLKPKCLLPPPGEFSPSDMYVRKRWRHIQFLAEEFWNRFRKEYLVTLQSRQKWNREKRNLEVNDLVLIKEDDQPRNMWKLGRVTQVSKDDKEVVRKVSLIVGTPNLSKNGKRSGNLTVLERPIHKLVLILEANKLES